MENPIKISVSQAAMKNGLMLGAYTILAYGVFVLSIHVPFLNILALLLFLGIPVAAYIIQKRFRNMNCPEFFPFSISWMLSLLTFLFKSVIGALAAYVYMRYLDHGALAQAVSDSFEAIVPIYTDSGVNADDLDTLGAIIESFKYITPGTFARQLFETTLFWGNMLSIAIAALTAKGSIRTLMNNKE